MCVLLGSYNDCVRWRGPLEEALDRLFEKADHVHFILWRTVQDHVAALKPVLLEAQAFVQGDGSDVLRVHSEIHLSCSQVRCREGDRFDDETARDACSAGRGCDIHSPDERLVCELAQLLALNPTTPTSSCSANAPRMARSGRGANRSATTSIGVGDSSSKLEAKAEGHS